MEGQTWGPQGVSSLKCNALAVGGHGSWEEGGGVGTGGPGGQEDARTQTLDCTAQVWADHQCQTVTSLTSALKQCGKSGLVWW